MPRRGTESEFELTTIDRLIGLGYEYVHGSEIERRSKEETILHDRFRASLQRRYPDLPEASLDDAVRRFTRPEGANVLRRSMRFHGLLRGGIDDLEVEHQDGRVEYRHVHAVDWDHPEANEFLVVNQLPIHGKNHRRPDVILYVNGLPLVVFELKGPFDEYTGVEGAYNQIRHYTHDIPQLFETNAVVVLSDSTETLHGVWNAPWEHFNAWKSIDGETIEQATTGSMKTLVEGLLTQERLLGYVRDFIVFEQAGGRITQKGAKYHQFFAVQAALERTLEVAATPGDRRIGVIWHTTGSGKSLSMVFLVTILRRHPALQNPAFVIEVDRNDLDNQLHDQFVGAHALVGHVKQADSTQHLRRLLDTQGGEVIFTTIEKFRLVGEGEDKELEHPVLSTRRNVIVIADEAHRTQYGFKTGYARYLADALPNALRLGFTGTPISFSGADTVEVFGDMIHTYDIRQSQLDKATVPIYYEPRQVKLHLSQGDIDAALEEIATGADPDEVEVKKGRWAALAKLARAEDRLHTLARDLLDHFRERTETLRGKAMVVCMTRENCVDLYDALMAIPGCPEIKVVMTGQIAKDPEAWNEAGHITTKSQRDAIKQRMLDPDDPLAMVLVCNMWLTGTDIPCLHTLYVDKPMKGHNVIQAVSRVNRVFRDKPHGLVVDYIGIGDELRQATATYARGGGRGEVAPEISDEAKAVFGDALREVRNILPAEVEDYGDWRRLSHVDLEDRYSLVYGYLTASEGRRSHFLEAEHKLSQAYLLVKHLDDCRPYADEIIFYQRARKQIVKIERNRPELDLDHAVQDLVDDSVASEGVVDIFAAAGLEKADISILDDEFLQTFKNQPHENLRVRLLERLMRDELKSREKKNLAQAKSFQERLEETLQKYHNRLIDAAGVIRVMVEIRKDLERQADRAQELGLEEEELAFYDAVAEHVEGIYDHPFLRSLIHDVVQAIKKNLSVDWTEPHREDVKARVRVAVKQVLFDRGIQQDDFDKILPFVMKQAEAAYRNWPLAA